MEIAASLGWIVLHENSFRAICDAHLHLFAADESYAWGGRPVTESDYIDALVSGLCIDVDGSLLMVYQRMGENGVLPTSPVYGVPVSFDWLANRAIIESAGL